jgi:hypothetical protein
VTSPCGKAIHSEAHEAHVWVGVFGSPRPTYQCPGYAPPSPVETARPSTGDDDACGATRSALNGILTCARPYAHTGYHMADNFVTWDGDSSVYHTTPAPEGNAPAVGVESNRFGVAPERTPEQEAKDKAREFWMQTAEADFEKCWAKAVQRSAVDLTALGSVFPGSTEEGARIRRGITFYAMGKAARISGRVAAGEEPNPDDELDLRVYSFMLAYVREFGGWPWPAK